MPSISKRILVKSRANLVHRDLKLENIMFTSPDKLHCKLIDFGFAEPIDEFELKSKSGTPGFLIIKYFQVTSLPKPSNCFLTQIRGTFLAWE